MLPTDDAFQELRDQLQKMQTVQERWNALSLAERAAIAKLSPDLSSFFRPKSKDRH
jgi:hypothetical protein